MKHGDEGAGFAAAVLRPAFEPGLDLRRQAVRVTRRDDYDVRLLRLTADGERQFRRYYEEAVRRRPTPSAHFNLALTLERMGRQAEARRHYEQALALDPGLEPARQRLRALQ